MLRVAYLCEFATLLGGERSLLTFLDHCPRAAVEPVVLCPATGRLAEELDERAIRRADWPGGRKSVERLPEHVASLEVDLVHANSLMTAGLAVEAAAHGRVPAVAHIRDIMRLSSRLVAQLNQLSRIMAVSGAVADWLKQSGVDASRIQTVYNAVDPAKMRSDLDRRAVRRDLNVPPDAFVVGCIGQIALRKAQDLFLEACLRAAAGLPNLQVWLVGERYSAKEESVKFEGRLHVLADAEPLRGKVQFLGCRRDVAALLTAMDLVVVPSRQEPLSRVALEALAMGRPVLATDVGGTAEILEGGRCGVLVAPDDPQALADQILRLAGNADLRQQLGRAGRRRVEFFSPQRNVETVVAVYRSVAHTHGASEAGGCESPSSK